MPSTVIADFDYRRDRRDLDILFTTGKRYIYHDVPPEAAERLQAAPSKGRYFNRRIRDSYDFTRVA